MPRKLDVHDREQLKASRAHWRRMLARRLQLVARARQVIARRDSQIKVARSERTGREKAVNFLHARLGRHEDPGRPNRAEWLDRWADHIGAWMRGQPWCGLAVWMAARAGGLELDKRVVSTVEIRRLAQAGTGGFKQWRPWVAGVKLDPGDILVYGTARSGPVHTGTYAGNGIVFEGNTSPGNGGSQNNGGGLYARRLSDRSGWILGVAVPNYRK